MSDLSSTLIEEMLRMRGPVPQPWDNPVVRMATVDLAYTGIGLPLVRFDGETQPSIAGYNALSYYSPQPGDRVIMLRISTAWVIVGSIDPQLRAYRVVDTLPNFGRIGELVNTDPHFWYEWDGDSWDVFQPWGVSWGRKATASDTGGETSASTTQVTLFTSTEFHAVAGRTYDIYVHHNWRGSTADNVIDYDVLINHNGVDTVLRTFREGNAVSTGTNASETVTGTVDWDCTADDPTCYFWTRAGRLTGAGTITMGSAIANCNDVGPTP